MIDEADTHQGGAGEEVIASTPEADTAIVQPSDNATEQDTGTDDTGQADETSDTPKRKPWWEKRFDELTAQKYEKAEEAAYWRGIAEASGQTKQPQPVQQEGPPDRWEDPEGYDQWLIEQAVSKFKQDQQQQTVLSTYEERVSKFRESKPDFESVVSNPSLRISPVMAEVIRVSEAGPQVAYHLGTNPTEAARIASLPEYLQAAELGRLEGRLSQPAPQPAQTRNPPPPPPKTVQGLSAGINKDPADMTMAEYAAWRQSQA